MQDQLRQMADRAEIVDGMHAYARWVDLNRPDEQVKVFVDDCRVNFGRGDDGWIEGREALQGALEAALAPFSATSHAVSNIEIDFDGADRATAVSVVQAWHRFRGDEPDFLLMARYHDRWVRTADGWKMAERRLKVAGTVGGPDPATLEPLGRREAPANGAS
jgi:hypothetical protein